MTTKNDANPTQEAAKSAAQTVDAMRVSATEMTAGMEAYGEKLAAFAKSAAAENVETIGRLFAAKTPQEFATVQIEALTHSVDRAVELNKIAVDTYVKSTNSVRAQLDTAVATFVKPFAA
jgi:phasin family protein